MTRARDLSNLIGYKTSDNQETLTATAGQTTFTVTGGYTAGFVNVWMNGLLLDPGVDYTATNGTTIVLTTAATAGDELEVLKYQTFNSTDTVNISGGDMTGDLTVATNVGIGTTSPTYTFDLLSDDTGYVGRFKSTGNYAGVIADAGTSGSGGGGYFAPMKGGTRAGILGTTGSIKGTNETNLAVWAETGKQLEFFTNGNTTTASAVIDTNGYVFKPYTPCFHAELNGTGSTISNGGVIAPYSATVTNISSSFNATTGRFTAPVSGRYMLYFSMSFGNVTSTNIWVAARFFKNATNVLASNYNLGSVDTNNNNSYDNVSSNMIIELSANDYIDVRMAYNTFNGDLGYGNFGGHLLG